MGSFLFVATLLVPVPETPDRLAESTGALVNATWALVFATIVVGIVTAYLVRATHKLVRETRTASNRAIGVQTWLTFVSRFDSEELVNARSKLARQLIDYAPPNDPVERGKSLSGSLGTKHDQINETVLNFFEDVGGLYRDELIDKKMTESSFSYYASHWWGAAETYVEYERKSKRPEAGLFCDFEAFAMAFGAEAKNPAAIRTFLEEEARLVGSDKMFLA